MRFETFVAFRYLRGKRKSRFVSVITLISVAGVSVGVIALIVVMSVMTGFDIELEASIIGNRSHLTVAQSGRAPIGNPEDVIRQIEALCPEILASGPVIRTEAILGTRHRNGMEYAGAFVLSASPSSPRT